MSKKNFVKEKNGELDSVKNVILITIDALRTDYCGFLEGKVKTPFLDKLANEGLCFAQAYTNGAGTPSSFSSLLSSTYPLMYGGYEKFSKARPAIQSYLKSNGIKTGAIHSNPYLSRHYGYDRDFDYFYDSFNEGSFLKTDFKEKLKKSIGSILSSYSDSTFRFGRRIFSTLAREDKPYIDADKTTEIALDWVSNNKDGRFFLWMNYMDVHWPYNPPEKYLENSLDKKRKEELNKYLENDNSDISKRDLEDLIELYKSEIRYVDFKLSYFFERLSEMGLGDKTAIILTSDHGEEFLDHGDLGHHPKLYEELIHIPLILWRRNFQGEEPVNIPVEHLDIPPTILNLLGLPSFSVFQGRNLLKLSNGSKPIISEVSNPHGVLKVDEKFRKTSCRKGKWKVISRENETELYDLESDPKESTDISNENRNKVRELEEEINNHDRNQLFF